MSAADSDLARFVTGTELQVFGLLLRDPEPRLSAERHKRSAAMILACPSTGKPTCTRFRKRNTALRIQNHPLVPSPETASGVRHLAAKSLASSWQGSYCSCQHSWLKCIPGMLTAWESREVTALSAGQRAPRLRATLQEVTAFSSANVQASAWLHWSHCSPMKKIVWKLPSCETV